MFHTHDSIPTTPNQPKEATMQELVKQPPEWTQVLSMFDALFSGALKYAEPLIKRMVDEQTAPLLERINNLQNSATNDIANLTQRIAALEARIDGATLTPLTHEYIAKVARESVEVSEDRIKEIADEVARDVMSEHVGDYDHDEYDRLEDKLDDKVSEAIDDFDMEDKLRDTFRNMTFSITARY